MKLQQLQPLSQTECMYHRRRRALKLLRVRLESTMRYLGLK
jgi:hypothetical protein